MAADGPTPRGLWRNGDFTMLWAAQTLSLAASQITLLAFPLTAILLLGASTLEVGLLVAIQYLPFLLIGLPTGAWVDRHRRRPLLIAADLARGALLLVVPIASWLGILHLAILYPVAFLLGVLTVLFDVAHLAYVPSVVRPSHLLDANARLQVSSASADLAGPGLGGALVQLLAGPTALLVNVVCYVASTAMLLRIGHREPPPVEHTVEPVWTDVVAGFRYVVGNGLLYPIALSTSLGNLFGLSGMVRALLPLFAVRTLHLSAAAFGLAVAATGVGAALGAIANGRVVRSLGMGRVLVVSAFLPGIALLLLSSAAPRTAMAVLAGSLFLIGLAESLYNVNQISVRQTITPPAMLGRMNATIRFFVWGSIPGGAFIGGLLASTAGVHEALLVAGTGSVLAGVPILLSRLRKLASLADVEAAASLAEAPG